MNRHMENTTFFSTRMKWFQLESRTIEGPCQKLVEMVFPFLKSWLFNQTNHIIAQRVTFLISEKLAQMIKFMWFLGGLMETDMQLWGKLTSFS